jgi:hypothetical protein
MDLSVIDNNQIFVSHIVNGLFSNEDMEMWCWEPSLDEVDGIKAASAYSVTPIIAWWYLSCINLSPVSITVRTGQEGNVTTKGVISIFRYRDHVVSLNNSSFSDYIKSIILNLK